MADSRTYQTDGPAGRHESAERDLHGVSEMDRRNDNQDERRPRGERWVIDKKIPLALVLVIFTQTAGAIWWAAAIDGRVTQLESRQVETGNSKVVERLARLEVLMEQAAKTLDNMDRRLDARTRERTQP